MTRWSPAPLADVSGGGDRTDSGLVTHRRRQASEEYVASEIAMRAHGTVGIPYIVPDAVERFLCHFLVAQIPTRGLPEVCESLCEVMEFYSEEAPVSHLLPQDLRIKAEAGARSDRPAFFLEED